ncbi:YbaB/EbfC family nucleoid-associated protein [Tuanshanicoccus lijuaniae]|uniref:YbaB/EbfC family nucleoid-associated protein n=1 Tax=Aerococcaceae bacterium zg-1292 TaxID=2774330 RepID=UPI001934F472|nr:YbaB/EbfC family nucleoid-associated protein [Aerococcaceae bacterium zg-1292]MBF6625354.1 YbaB/EbfC family nucleoid-associated protein [Aerococcaceae bacterium zg-BR9]MBF6979014.1 YbaB/EbfC family nucleoid-associated protein [Aerococcaceae bacterium zg-BR22]MBS4456125.1 YbaB/EbfC family nucleoid-associated protein [Aerococcaceae bacterium zg-A91]MBS4457976.1 YbaB/EbfC family nucleoid-associated protein [Aerococcaceae bacterium zg-BR33]
MRGMGNMGNIQGMLQKAQKLQKEMDKEQAKIEETVFEKSDNNQLVTVKMTGNYQITELTIAPDLLDPDDVEMLQDLVLSTVNDLITDINTTTKERLGKFSKGMNLPF